MINFTQIQQLPIDLTYMGSCMSSDGSIMLVSGYDIMGSSKLYISKNSGVNWKLIPNITGYDPSQVVCDFNGKNIIYCNRDNLYISNDYGESFKLINFPISNKISIGVSIGASRIENEVNMYYTVFGNGKFSIFRSENSGVSWSEKFSNKFPIFRITSALSNGCSYVFVSSNRETTILYGYSSTNYGDTWIKPLNYISNTQVGSITTDRYGLNTITSFITQSKIYPQISNNYNLDYKSIYTNTDDIVFSNKNGPSTIDRNGYIFLCVKSVSDTKSQIYVQNTYNSSADILSEESQQWTTLSLNDQNYNSVSNIIVLAGTNFNGMFIGKNF